VHLFLGLLRALKFKASARVQDMMEPPDLPSFSAARFACEISPNQAPIEWARKLISKSKEEAEAPEEKEELR
jgi:hypothetical protein